MKITPFADKSVKAHFDTYPPKVRKRMLALRELVFSTAASTPGVGELLETLKWGEPAYLTVKSKTGSTVRMDWKAKRPGQYALYFNCQTSLVESFRTHLPTDFHFEGNRALVFDVDKGHPNEELALCLEAALTYHVRK